MVVAIVSLAYKPKMQKTMLSHLQDIRTQFIIYKQCKLLILYIIYIHTYSLDLHAMTLSACIASALSH